MAVLPWTIAPMSIATGVCATLTLWLWIRQGRVAVPSTPLGRPTLAWFAALLLAATFAVNREASFAKVTKGLFPALALLGAYHARTLTTGRRAIAVWFVSACAAALFGFALFVAHGAQLQVRARGAVGHYMTFGGQLLLLTCVAAGIALATRDRRWRLAAVGVAAIGALALASTFTRSAWLGLAAALVLMVGLARPRVFPALVAVLVAVVLLAPASYRARLASAFDPWHPANVERTHMWAAGIHMFRDHPITGVGLADLHALYDRYRSPEAVEHAGHLHSVPIQIAATTGIIGLAAFVWLYLALLRCGAVGLRASLRSRGLGAGFRLGVLGAFVGFLVAGLFEWNFGDEELLYPLYILAGMAWAAREWDAGDGGGA